MCCVYCQAQDSEQLIKGIMNKETALKAVEVALQSPNRYLTFEFQGGEPLTNFEVIKEIKEYINQKLTDVNLRYGVDNEFRQEYDDLLQIIDKTKDNE